MTKYETKKRRELMFLRGKRETGTKVKRTISIPKYQDDWIVQHLDDYNISDMISRMVDELIIDVESKSIDNIEL